MPRNLRVRVAMGDRLREMDKSRFSTRRRRSVSIPVRRNTRRDLGGGRDGTRVAGKFQSYAGERPTARLLYLFVGSLDTSLVREAEFAYVEGGNTLAELSGVRQAA